MILSKEMLELKISSITSTLALAAISLATLTTSGGNHLDSFVFDTGKAAIYEPYIGNSNSSEILMTSLNSSLFSYHKDLKNQTVLNEKISNEVFGEMRYLTPEENARKLKMYRSMSTAVAGASFFD